MSATPKSGRVKIWNSFLSLARSSSQQVFELSHGCPARRVPFRPLGGTLGDEPTAVLASLVFCALAVEARTNHLIEKLVERQVLTRKEAQAASFLTPEQKWFLLPKLAGRRQRIRSDQYPHRAISDICKHRNALIHVQFDRIATRLPDAQQALSLFEHLVDAMDDMNSLLGHSRGPRKKVRAFGRFSCA
jgi:hypothetical protein